MAMATIQQALALQQLRRDPPKCDFWWVERYENGVLEVGEHDAEAGKDFHQLILLDGTFTTDYRHVPPNVAGPF